MSKPVVLIALTLTVAVLVGAARDKANKTECRTKPKPIPARLKGVTLEDVQNQAHGDREEQEKYDKLLSKIETALVSHSAGRADKFNYWPTARIVFDLENDKESCGPTNPRNCQNADNYRELAARLHGVKGTDEDRLAFVMGEILDSHAMTKCDADCYEQRTRHYLSRLGDVVDIWEIGNEVNGDWARPTHGAGNPESGDHATIDRESKEIGEKLKRAYTAVREAGGRTALTLYFNYDSVNDVGCAEHPEDKMIDWAKNYVPPEVKNGVCYVLVSFYENGDDCPKVDPRKVNWEKEFTDLSAVFPNSYIGFGECCKGGDREKKIDLYYGELHRRLVGKFGEDYVGGYFYWDYKKHMVLDRHAASRRKFLDGALQKW